MLKKEFLIFVLLACFAVTSSAQTAMPLWPDGAPNAIGKEPQDMPTITPFLAPKETATGAAVLVLPGGGYTRLSDVKEGSDIAKWLNSLGISAFVLKYRLGPRYNQPNPLLDAARAMRTIRHRAAEWGVDTKRVAILGFSAGGHLASTMGTKYDAGKADAKDEIERMSSRPDAMILLYPVITMGEFTHAGSKKYLLGENPTPELIKLYSNELHITKDTPPTFLMHTMNDASVPVENAMLFASALRKKSVLFEFHLYEQGPHGVGLAPANPYLASWAARCADWLVLRGFLKK